MGQVFLRVMQVILTYKRNKIIKKHINDDDKIIGDFGCGHFPNRYATLLVDTLSSEDVQRGGLEVRREVPGKRFVDLNLNQFPYPFEDKYFDFVICSHVLEHLDDPVRTCQEFSRIAKKGYIEVPFYCVDLFIDNNKAIHKYLCAYDQERRILRFVNRQDFLDVLPPSKLNIFYRFLLQLSNLSLVWKDMVHAEYLQIHPGA